MKKLLAIIVLGSLLVGCNQNRNDEYICKFISGSPHEDVTLEIYKDKVKMQYESGANFTY